MITTEGVSFIVFARNERKDILKTVDSILNCMSTLDMKYEIFVIDDGSTDGTFKELSNQKKSMSWSEKDIKVHRQDPKGIASAISWAVAQAKYNKSIPIPGHFMFDASELIKLVKNVNSAEVVIGYRSNLFKERPVGKFTAAKILKLVFKLFIDSRVIDPHGLIIYPTSILQNKCDDSMKHENHIRMLAWCKRYTLSLNQVPIRIRAGHKLDSNIKGRPSFPRIEHLKTAAKEVFVARKIILGQIEGNLQD